VSLRERQVEAEKARLSAESERLANVLASVTLCDQDNPRGDEDTENIPPSGSQGPRVHRMPSRPSLVPRRPLEERKSTFV
jgi:hypothetical protein